MSSENLIALAQCTPASSSLEQGTVNSGYGTCTRTDRASWVRHTVSNLPSPRMTASHPETSARSHLRAIHKLALSTHLPHYCITGSADGDMRAWVWTCSFSTTQRADYMRRIYVTCIAPFSASRSRPRSGLQCSLPTTHMHFKLH
jgi:hypothetical protein